MSDNEFYNAMDDVEHVDLISEDEESEISQNSELPPLFNPSRVKKMEKVSNFYLCTALSQDDKRIPTK